MKMVNTRMDMEKRGHRKDRKDHLVTVMIAVTVEEEETAEAEVVIAVEVEETAEAEVIVEEGDNSPG
jgi:hypothetical protein